jgi:two-component system, LytTR family, sensor kinase
VLFGLGVGLVTFGLRVTLVNEPSKMGYTSEFLWTLALNGFYWLSWAMLVPLIVRSAQRVPVPRTPECPVRRLRRLIGYHLLVGLAFTLVQTLISATMRFGLRTAVDGQADWWRIVIVNLSSTFDWGLCVYLAVVAVMYARQSQAEVARREVRESQLEARLAEAQLQALQRQLQPHFLFNTLHAIHTLVRSDPRAAEHMIERLGELLRVSLANAGQHLVPLETELAHLEKYLAIEKVHFGTRLSFDLDVPLGLRDVVVPYLILQPLVENSVRHGIAPVARPGRIRVRARRSADNVEITVADNGRGLSSADLAHVNEGVGIANTRARLDRLYKDRYRLEFFDTEGGGLTVKLVLPYVVTGEWPLRPALEVAV